MAEYRGTVVIAGANRGVGFGMVPEFLARGLRVVGTYRSAESAGELLHMAQERPDDVIALPLDVRSDTSVADFFRLLALRCTSIDILVHNAGILHKGESHIEITAAESLLETFDVNAVGPLRVAKALLPLLRKGRDKKIAFVSSIMGSLRLNTQGRSHSYRMSKAALNMLMLSLAVELKNEGILSFALHPGWARTAMGGPNATVPVAESARGMVQVILAACVDSHGGKLFDYKGVALEL